MPLPMPRRRNNKHLVTGPFTCCVLGESCLSVGDEARSNEVSVYHTSSCRMLHHSHPSIFPTASLTSLLHYFTISDKVSLLYSILQIFCITVPTATCSATISSLRISSPASSYLRPSRPLRQPHICIHYHDCCLTCGIYLQSVYLVTTTSHQPSPSAATALDSGGMASLLAQIPS
jgi:hypothetical protein